MVVSTFPKGVSYGERMLPAHDLISGASRLRPRVALSFCFPLRNGRIFSPKQIRSNSIPKRIAKDRIFRISSQCFTDQAPRRNVCCLSLPLSLDRVLPQHKLLISKVQETIFLGNPYCTSQRQELYQVLIHCRHLQTIHARPTSQSFSRTLYGLRLRMTTAGVNFQFKDSNRSGKTKYNFIHFGR